jgi:release factor glutamine methyltransferase
MQARELIRDAIGTLKASTANDHWQASRERIEAEELLGFVLGEEPEPRDQIPASAATRFKRLVARRASGEPLPYIKGFTDFRGLDHLARPGVFVPRDSSEFLAEQAIRRLRRRSSPVAVDLATGGGTIALAIANEVPRARVFGADVSKEAIALARTNARRFGLSVRFAVGDLFEAIPRAIAGTVDVITLHPPYVPVGDVRHLPDEIREWEPVHTLTDRSRDGLGLIGRTVTEAPDWLRTGGWLLMEVSPDRAREVAVVFRSGGFREVRSTKGGPVPVTRVIVGRRP